MDGHAFLWPGTNKGIQNQPVDWNVDLLSVGNKMDIIETVVLVLSQFPPDVSDGGIDPAFFISIVTGILWDLLPHYFLPNLSPSFAWILE